MGPKYLYRYRSFVADVKTENLPIRAVEELRNAQLRKTWFSKVSEQNDPFDTNPYYQDSSVKDVRDFMIGFRKVAGSRASFANDDFIAEAKARGIKKAQAKKHLTNWPLHIATTRHTFKEYRRNTLISCFSTEIRNILMWSYYGNSHTSYCLRFKLDEGGNGRSAVAEVRYLEERPYLNTMDMMRRMAAASRPNQFDYGDQDNERVDNATLLCKSDHWEHEKEWRAIKTPDQGEGYHSIAPYRLDKIILGANTSKATEIALRSSIEDVRLSKCKLSETHYELQFENIL